tara:strand:+ start:252 stop:2348 length:2097 start_codon:yes stop_codon:yes gene_type:complete
MNWGRIFSVGVIGLLSAIAYCAEAAPHVVGYERFHGDDASVEGGAILYSELGCANCHGGSVIAFPRMGPNLMDLSARVDREWVGAFLKNPQSGREGTTMPGMLHDFSAEELDSVLAYLGSLSSGVKFATARHANAERGSALYHEKGCIACHAPTADFLPPHGGDGLSAEGLAVSLPDLQKKTHYKALAAFLISPSTYRPDGRMPHLPLDTQEAMDVTAHLLDFQSSNPKDDAKTTAQWPKVTQALIAQGQVLVSERRCASCHDLPDLDSVETIALPSRALKQGNHCLSAEPGSEVPYYGLTEKQRESLSLFLEDGRDLKDVSGELSLAAMNCFACHDRDGVGGPTIGTNPFFVGDESLGDSGRLPPPLTGIGQKLKHEWMDGVLEGKPENRVRPYLKTLMPAYPNQADAIADWLVEIDDGSEYPAMVHHEEDLEAGRKLLGVSGGVNCIICHNWGDKSSLGIPSLDISALDQRLRPEWFRQYLLNPASYRPGTLMPPLWPGGHSSVPDVLGGDSERQIAAIWSFIEKGEGVPEGFPEHRSGQFELIPLDRPIIQRTFLEGVGTKSILVGFPGGMNLAYDGLKGRPGLVWRGRFFDAYDTWFTRKIVFQQPLEEAVNPFSESSEEARFRGYRVTKEGDPVFIVTNQGREIEDAFGSDGEALIRKVSWENGDAPAVTHPVGVEVDEKREGNTLTIRYTWK